MNTNNYYPKTATVNVYTTLANQPLVSVGGKGLESLREDFYDNAFYTQANIYCAYDIALSGGEPYAVWN
jgi:hypothetical protein